MLTMCLGIQAAKAQVVASNPLEWMALAEGNELINKQVDKQINGQTKTAILQNTIAAEFNQIHKWEKKYNSYLKTANGYDERWYGRIWKRNVEQPVYVLSLDVDDGLDEQR